MTASHMADRAPLREAASASAVMFSEIGEQMRAAGRYFAECFDKDGNLKWRDEIINTVMTEGKNVVLDQALAGSSYSVTGPYMGLISSSSYSAISSADVGTQINGTNGWKEAGGTNAPTYSGNRKTCAWSSAAAGAKALSSALSFSITGTGTIKGCFIVFFTGAVNTKDDAHGTLLSAGLFSGGDRAVLSGDTVNVSYTLSL